jgi:hypothetical protein
LYERTARHHLGVLLLDKLPIEQSNMRVSQGAGDSHPLLFSTREFARKTMGEVFDLCEGQAGYGTFTKAASFQAAAAAQFQGEEHIFQDSQRGK